MATLEPDGIVWHTSSFSNGGAACVEVGWRTGCDGSGVAADRVLVRDSKDRTAPALVFSAPAWRAFLAALAP
ncbi:MAG: DUF397 domain-containing protein [Pseudonocardia sp.]